MVVCQQAGTQTLRERDVQRVSSGEVVAISPRGRNQRRDRRMMKMP